MSLPPLSRSSPGGVPRCSERFSRHPTLFLPGCLSPAGTPHPAGARLYPSPAGAGKSPQDRRARRPHRAAGDKNRQGAAEEGNQGGPAKLRTSRTPTETPKSVSTQLTGEEGRGVGEDGPRARVAVSESLSQAPPGVKDAPAGQTGKRGGTAGRAGSVSHLQNSQRLRGHDHSDARHRKRFPGGRRQEALCE